MASIGEISKATGISVEAIRYYEKQGLVAAANRRPNGYRNYTDATVHRIHFILNAKQAGLRLNEIHELLSLSLNSSSQSVKILIDDKLEEINNKLQSLQKIQQTLEQLSSSCDGSKAISDCPIMDAFNTDN